MNAADSGQTVVVEMPDQRLLVLQPLDPQEDDTLMDGSARSNSKFQALVEKSKASRAQTVCPGRPLHESVLQD